MHFSALVLPALTAAGVVYAEALPAATPVAQLLARAVDPALVGYVSASNGGYSDGRTCDYPATVTTSGNFAQCCSSGGPCNFYTACSGATLMAGSSTVDCNVVGGDVACNTAILAATPGANGGKSYLACWQKTLGSSAFTFVQDIGSATVAPASVATTAAGTGSSARSTSGASRATSAGSQASSAAGGNSAGTASSPSSSSSRAAAAGVDSGFVNGGVIAAVMAFAQVLF